MEFSRFRVYFLISLTLFLFALTPQARAVSGDIPLSSDIYPTLDFLVSRGLLRSYLSGTRPITWGEAHRLYLEAGEKIREREADGREVPPDVREALKSLEKKVYERITGPAKVGAGSTYFMVKNPTLQMEYLEGGPSPVPGIKASQHALIYNNGGIDPDEGMGANIEMEVEGANGPFLIQMFPRLTTGEKDNEIIHSGSLKVGGLFGMELDFARENLWWGQGVHGGLYLTDNAAPLPMIHLSTPHPSTLPWIFKYLGPTRFEFFVSRLGKDRAVPEPDLIGLRTNFRPLYALEIGMTMMAMVNGEGRPHVSAGDLFRILFGENDVSDDRSNKIAGFDLRLNLPNWQFYLEFGGEDEAGGWPSKMAGMAGLFFPRLTGSMDLRVEYADLALDEESARAWYRHGTYTDGYTYEGRILGHHAGGGGRDLFTELTFDVGKKGRGRLGIDLEERGKYVQPEIERHTQVSAGWKHPLSMGNIDTALELNAAVDKVTNKGYVEGEEDTDYYVSVKIGLEI